MELVRARLQDHVGDGARGTAQFGVVIAGGNVHRLDGFNGRNQDLQQAGALVIVDALDLIIIGHTALAVDFGL